MFVLLVNLVICTMTSECKNFFAVIWLRHTYVVQNFVILNASSIAKAYFTGRLNKKGQQKLVSSYNLKSFENIVPY